MFAAIVAAIALVAAILLYIYVVKPRLAASSASKTSPEQTLTASKALVDEASADPQSEPNPESSEVSAPKTSKKQK